MNVAVLYQIGTPITLVCGLGQLLLWLRRRSETAFALWSAGNIVGGCGAALLLLRDHAPWWVSSSLANALIVGGGLLIWGGMRRSAGGSVPWRWYLAITLLVLALLQLLNALSKDLALRVVLASMILFVYNAAVAFDLLRYQHLQPLKTRQMLCVLFTLHALFYLFRSATAATLDADDEFLRTQGIQNVALLIGMAKLMLWNVVAVLMIAERDRQALEAPTAPA